MRNSVNTLFQGQEASRKAIEKGRRYHTYLEALITGRVDELIPCVFLDGHVAACAFVQGCEPYEVTPEQRAAMKELSFVVVVTTSAEALP